VPAARMVTLDADTTIDDVVATVKKTGYSRYPVHRGNSGEIIGFVHSKDLLGVSGAKKLSSVRKVIRPPYLIPDDRKIDAQLRAFKSRKLHQAVVLGDDKEVAGLVTLEDILEQMVGSIEDEHDAGQGDVAGK